jgi:hypothetical protein
VTSSITTKYRADENVNGGVVTVENSGEITKGALTGASGYETHYNDFDYKSGAREITTFNFEFVEGEKHFTDGNTQFKTFNVYGFPVSVLTLNFDMNGEGTNAYDDSYTRDITDATYTKFYGYDSRGNASKEYESKYEVNSEINESINWDSSKEFLPRQ